MVKELNEMQKQILSFYKENGLRKTCEKFNLRTHQVVYIVGKSNKLAKNQNNLLNVKIVDSDAEINSHENDEISVILNDVLVKGSLQNIRLILGVKND